MSALLLIFSFFSLMSVCLLWMELALSLTPQKKTIRMVKKGLLSGGMILFLSSGIYSAWAKATIVIVLAAVICTIVLVVGFWKVPPMLFNTLSIHESNRAWSIRQVRPMDSGISEQVQRERNSSRHDTGTARKCCESLRKFYRNRPYKVNIPAEKLKLILDFSSNLILNLFVLLFSLVGLMVTYYLPIKAGRVFFVCLFLMILAISRLHLLLIQFITNSQTEVKF